jgi:3-oxoacyl-[acyl-carrier-protein] synthase-3
MKDRETVATTIDSVAVVAGNVVHHSAERLADRAVRDALAAAAIQPADVDLLLNAGLFHDRMLGEPALAALIQGDVGANPEDPHGEGHGTFSFDVATGSAGVLSALQIADGFLRAGTIRHAVIVASDANPGHGMSAGFPYDPVGAALVCGWDPSDRGIANIRWMTVADAPARRHAVMRFEHGHNRLLVREDDAFAAQAAACAGTVVVELLEDNGLRPEDVAGVAVAPFDTAFIDELVPHTGIAPDRFVRPGPTPRFHTAGLIASIAQVTSRAPAHGGERVLLVAAGAGIIAGAALLFR